MLTWSLLAVIYKSYWVLESLGVARLGPVLIRDNMEVRNSPSIKLSSSLCKLNLCLSLSWLRFSPVTVGNRRDSCRIYLQSVLVLMVETPAKRFLNEEIVFLHALWPDG